MDHFAAVWPNVDFDDYLAAINEPAPSAAALAIVSRMAAALTRREDWRKILLSGTKEEMHNRAIARGRQYTDRKFAPLWLSILWGRRGLKSNARLGWQVRTQRRGLRRFSTI